MSEYIKREQVLKLLESAQAWNWSMDTLHGEIQALPAEDVAPVVHGEWMRYSRTLWHYCSVCLEDALMSKSTGTEVLSSFCPHCGAKMDLEDD